MKRVDFNETNEGAAFLYEGTDRDTVVAQVELMLKQDGYKLEKGEPGKGVYGVGNTAMRVIFGAFHKRFTFNVDVKAQEDKVRLDFSKHGSGMSGGVVGMKKLTKEKTRIVEKFKNLGV